MKNIIKYIRYLQTPEADVESSPDVAQILVEIATNLLLFLLIFGMAGTVDVRNLKRQLGNRYAILTGIAMQFIVMPLLGFIAVLSLKDHGLTTSMGITLLIVTASPGGSYSNWWCSLFNADLALSVAMTALSTILSIGLLPANLMLYAHAAYKFDSTISEDGAEVDVLKSVDFVALFISLSIVIGAIVTGIYASYKTNSKRFHKIANALGSFSGLALIVLSGIFSTTTIGEAEEGAKVPKPWEQDWSFYVGVSMPCVVGLFLANLIARFARLEKPEIVTLSVECCYQNVGIATSAVLAMFDDPNDVANAMAVPLLYGLVEMIVLGLYCLVAWKLNWTKAPKDDNFCLVITKTYEIEDIDEEEGDVEMDLPAADKDDQSKAVSTAQTASVSTASRTNNGADEFSLPSPRARIDTGSTSIASSQGQGQEESPKTQEPKRLEMLAEETQRSRIESDGDLSFRTNNSSLSFGGSSTLSLGRFWSPSRTQSEIQRNPLPYQTPCMPSPSTGDSTDRPMTAESSYRPRQSSMLYDLGQVSNPDMDTSDPYYDPNREGRGYVDC
jgi:predicted Na+-dependent transporter